MWGGPDAVECTLKARERHLAEESAEDLLAAIEAGLVGRALLPWLPLHQGGGAAKMIDGWLALFALETNEQRRADLVYNTRVFASTLR